MPINSFLYPGAKVTTGYDVDNSLRFNDDSSDYLEKNFSSTQDSRRIFTVSAWIKRANVNTSDQRYWGSSEGSGEGYNSLGFDGSNRLKVLSGNTSNSGTQLNFASNQVFRDVSAWSHIVYAVDTTQSTESNRVKIYHNGSQITSWSTATYPSQNTDLLTSTTPQMTIGMRDLRGGNANFFDGYLAEMVFIDNQQLAPDQFGEFDEDSGIWKPKDVSGLTFGTNGFYLDFEDSSALGDDVSGNNNDFTVNNLTAIDQSTDTCTNNFATANPLIANSNITYAEGNLKTSHTYANQWRWTSSTIGVDNGKWYAEFKVSAVGSETAIGILPEDAINENQDSGNDFVGKFTDSVAYLYNGQIYKSNSIDNNTSTYTTNDIVGVALDLNSNSIQFYKNGSSVGSAVSLTANKNYFFGCAGYNTAIILWNFGSSSYTISSGNTDGNGYGNFEYAVPSGYYSLCTKNLVEYG